MTGTIIEEFDINCPELVFQIASRDMIVKKCGRKMWDTIYKAACNKVREICGLSNNAICLSTYSSNSSAILDFRRLHVTVLDYEIGDNEHFFIKSDRCSNEYEIRDDDPEINLDSIGDDIMGKRLSPIKQTEITDPFIVQFLLSQPYIQQRKGNNYWSEKYIKTILDVQNKLGREDEAWYNGMVLVGVKTDEYGIADYKQVIVSQFDYELHSNLAFSIDQDGSGKFELIIEDDKEE